jgi:acetoacetate decarboxylase
MAATSDLTAIKASLETPNCLLKIIRQVDGAPRISELVEYYLEDIDLKRAWTRRGALDLHAHALTCHKPMLNADAPREGNRTHLIGAEE